MIGPTASPVEAPPCRILIVPHCGECGGILQSLLSLGGYLTDIIRGADAFARALEVQPQAVLVDINLPDADGWEVARHLRAALGSAVRLIGLAPSGWEGDPAAWAEAGFDAWLHKPASPDELFRALARPRRT